MFVSTSSADASDRGKVGYDHVCCPQLRCEDICFLELEMPKTRSLVSSYMKHSYANMVDLTSTVEARGGERKSWV